MTGGESVRASLQLLIDNWDKLPVRYGGRTMLLSEIPDAETVCRQVVRFLVSRHIPEAQEGPDEVSGP